MSQPQWELSIPSFELCMSSELQKEKLIGAANKDGLPLIRPRFGSAQSNDTEQ